MIRGAGSSAILGAEHLARLRRHIWRGLRGETVTIGAIGGSITAGTGASTPAHRYVERVAAWWRGRVGADVRLVHAGIGGTGSNYGALRASRDLLEQKPDIVFVEFAVNDPDDVGATESLEGLCRQILQQPNAPAVILILMVTREGWSAEAHHRVVGVHYGLPMINLREGVARYVEAAGSARDALFADEVHPNDEGHELAAALVTRLLARGLRIAENGHTSSPASKIRRPLVSDRYERVRLMEAAYLHPERNRGWTFDPWRSAWVAETPGSVIEFRIEGRAPLLMEWIMRGPMGSAAVSVDGGAVIEHDAYLERAGGGWRATSELPAPSGAASHVIRIEILAARAAASSGNEFRILGLGAADTSRMR